MNRRRACVCVLGGVALWLGVVSAQAAGQGGQGAAGRAERDARAARHRRGQGGFVAYPQRPVTRSCRRRTRQGALLGQLRVLPRTRRARRRQRRPEPDALGRCAPRRQRRAHRSRRPRRPCRQGDAAVHADAGADLRRCRVPSQPSRQQPHRRASPSTSSSAMQTTGRTLFQAKCSSCHSPTGDLQGVANRFADPKLLQQTWLLPGTGGTRGGGPPRPAPPIGAVVTLANGQKVEGTLNRLDDFMVSLKMADGTYRTFRTDGAECAKSGAARSAERPSRSAPDLQRRRHSQHHRVSRHAQVKAI